VFARILPMMLALSVWSLAGRCCSQQLTGVPQRAAGIGVDERLGAQIPAETTFRDMQDRLVTPASLLSLGKPLLVTFNYSDCPGLCIAHLDGLSRTVEGMNRLLLGRDFLILSIGLDPTETLEKIAATHRKYTVGLTGHDPNGWHFWRGNASAIRQMADAFGFRFTYDSKHKRFDHAAMTAVVDPTGKIVRYAYDVALEPQKLEEAIREAGRGEVGSPWEAFLLWCFHYDALENRYSADARKLLALAAGAFSLILLGGTAPFWRFARKPSQESSSETSDVAVGTVAGLSIDNSDVLARPRNTTEQVR
jgi:protein SCO1/2